MLDYKVKKDIENSELCGVLEKFNILDNGSSVYMLGVGNALSDVSFYIKQNNNSIIEIKTSIRSELNDLSGGESVLVFKDTKYPMSLFSSSLERIMSTTVYDDLGNMSFSCKTTLICFITKYITRWVNRSNDRKKEFEYKLSSTNTIKTALNAESLFKN